MNGKLGPTAQYWCMYIYLVNRLYRPLMRAVRTNDVDAYIKILPRILDVFFGLNRPNYSRWGVIFLAKLRNAPVGCVDMLKNGAFSIRRTKKNYSRSAVDITLEQTLNKNAACPSRGLVHFQSSNDAIRKWCISSHQRSMCVTELKIFLHMETVEQAAAQNTKTRIERDNSDRISLENVIKRNVILFL